MCQRDKKSMTLPALYGESKFRGKTMETISRKADRHVAVSREVKI